MDKNEVFSNVLAESPAILFGTEFILLPKLKTSNGSNNSVVKLKSQSITNNKRIKTFLLTKLSRSIWQLPSQRIKSSLKFS